MKITMFEIEATAEDLKVSRTVADSLTMIIQRMADAVCGFGNVADEQEEDEVTE